MIRLPTINYFLRAFKATKNYALWLIGVPLLAVVLVLYMVSKIVPLWEAVALVEVGQVGQVGQAYIELPSVVNLRVMQPNFFKSVLAHSDVESKQEVLPVLKSSFKVSQVKGTDLLEIKLNAKSPEISERLIQGVISEIQASHADIYDSRLQKMREYLREITLEIEAEKRIQNILGKIHDNPKRWSDRDIVLAASVSQTQLNLMHELQQRKRAVEEQLGPSHTFLTRIVGTIVVSEQPVSPNKLLIVLMTIFVSFFVVSMGICLFKLDALQKTD